MLTHLILNVIFVCHQRHHYKSRFEYLLIIFQRKYESSLFQLDHALLNILTKGPFQYSWPLGHSRVCLSMKAVGPNR